MKLLALCFFGLLNTHSIIPAEKTISEMGFCKSDWEASVSEKLPHYRRISILSNVNDIPVANWVTHLIQAYKNQNNEDVELMYFRANNNLEQAWSFYKHDPEGCGEGVLLSAWLRAALIDEDTRESFENKIKNNIHHLSLPLDTYKNYCEMIDKTKSEC